MKYPDTFSITSPDLETMRLPGDQFYAEFAVVGDLKKRMDKFFFDKNYYYKTLRRVYNSSIRCSLSRRSLIEYRENGLINVLFFLPVVMWFSKNLDDSWQRCLTCNSVFIPDVKQKRTCNICQCKTTEANKIRLQEARRKITKTCTCQGCGKEFESCFIPSYNGFEARWTVCCSKRCTGKMKSNERLAEIEHMVTDIAIDVHQGVSLTEVEHKYSISRSVIKKYLKAYHIPFDFLSKTKRRDVATSVHKGKYSCEEVFVTELCKKLTPIMDSVEREVLYGQGGRCDIVARFGMFRYAIECKNSTEGNSVTTCIGQALCAGFDLGCAPVCCFPDTIDGLEFHRKVCKANGIILCLESELLTSLGVLHV